MTLVQRHTRHRAQSSSAQVSKASKHSSSMFGYSHSPASQPCQASTWWSSPPGHAAVPSWQPPTDSHWWSHPPPSSPAWVRPATHTQIWGEPPAQWMHPGTGYYPPNQPLAIMAYPNQQLMPQQQCHYIQTPLCPAQPKEQDLVLKRIEQATDRMAQLETAVKAKQEEANQGSAAMGSADHIQGMTRTLQSAPHDRKKPSAIRTVTSPRPTRTANKASPSSHRSTRLSQPNHPGERRPPLRIRRDGGNPQSVKAPGRATRPQDKR